MSYNRSSSRGMSAAANPSGCSNLLTSAYRSRATAQSEHETFRRRNQVQTNYSGPVYVTEEIYVPCSSCSAPVNAVERVPVGTSWYHPQCLHCQICKKGSRTTAFYSVNGAPVCANCHSAGGYASKPDRRSFLADNNLLMLSNGVKLDTRTTTVRQAILMERQAICSAQDSNIVLTLPPIAGRRGSASPSNNRRTSPPQQKIAGVIGSGGGNSSSPLAITDGSPAKSVAQSP